MFLYEMFSTLYIYIYIYIYICVYICVCVYIYVCVYVYVCVYICVYICVWLYVCVCVYIYIYIYIYIWKNGLTQYNTFWETMWLFKCLTALWKQSHICWYHFTELGLIFYLSCSPVHGVCCSQGMLCLFPPLWHNNIHMILKTPPPEIPHIIFCLLHRLLTFWCCLAFIYAFGFHGLEIALMLAW